jgi:hypothetical protein
MTEQLSPPPDSNKSDRKAPAAVQRALEALKLLAEEDSAAAEGLNKLLPAFAMKLFKAGEEVTVENLLDHARQGVEHLTAARTVMTEQKPPTYAEVAAKFKPPAAPEKDEEDKFLKEQGFDFLKEQMFDAAKTGDTQKVKDLLDRGVGIHTGGKYIHTENSGVLEIAAHFGHIETIGLLLDRGLYTHAQYDDIMIFAAANGYTETVRLLLDRGADLHARNDLALQNAAHDPHVETMHFLIEKGASLTSLSPRHLKIYHDFCAAKDRWQTVARCEPPQRLWRENPAHFRPRAFDAVKAMFAAEDFLDNHLNDMAFNTVALFQTEQRVLQYLEKWGATGKQPLHDIIYFIKAPADEGADTKAWGDAALKCGPGMAKLFSFADRLPQPEKSSDGKTWSYQNTREKVAQFAYKRANEHAELAALCFENTMTEEDFNAALELVKNQKKDLAKNLPEIVINGKEFDMEEAVFRRLAAKDVRGLVLGQLTDCCQSIGGGGAECAEHGFMSENGGFYVVEKDGREIIAQTWAWRGKQGELVLDSLETLGKRVTDKQWKKLTAAFAKALAENPGTVTALLIGTGGATPKNLTKAFNTAAAAKPLDYTGYRDSKKQLQVWKSKSYKP